MPALTSQHRSSTATHCVVSIQALCPLEQQSVKCRDNLPPFRYVIVQLPLYNHFVACEIEVLVRGTRMSNINILIFTNQADSCLMLLFFLHVEEHLAIVLHDLLDYCLTW